MTAPQLDEPIDGRTARAVRTRDAIVEATLALIDDGDLRPTGPRIAERAGVSVRSVFQHFDDLDGLFQAVGDLVTVRLAGLITRIDPRSPLPARVDAFVTQRTQVLETVTPVLRAALVHAASSKVIKKQFHGGHSFFRDQVAQVFATELDTADDAEELRTALVVALSWTAWEMLRTSEGATPAEARARMAWMVRAALRHAGMTP